MVANPKDIAGHIDRMITDAFADLERQALEEIGHEAVGIIVLRTKAGLDADRKPFAPYSSQYAEERQRAGYSAQVDLARTGQMLGAMIPKIVGPGEVAIQFLDANAEAKAQFHNDGTNKRNSAINVRSHSRDVFVDIYTGRRVSRDEAAKDRRRKNKRVAQRTENVGEHQRNGGLPQRNFFDVRHPDDLALIQGAIEEKFERRFK